MPGPDVEPVERRGWSVVPRLFWKHKGQQGRSLPRRRRAVPAPSTEGADSRHSAQAAQGPTTARRGSFRRHAADFQATARCSLSSRRTAPAAGTKPTAAPAAAAPTAEQPSSKAQPLRQREAAYPAAAALPPAGAQTARRSNSASKPFFSLLSLAFRFLMRSAMGSPSLSCSLSIRSRSWSSM